MTISNKMAIFGSVAIVIAGVGYFALRTRALEASAADAISCDSKAIIQSLQSSEFSNGTRIFDVRDPGASLHPSPSDVMTMCVAVAITNFGDRTISYGWEAVNGKIYTRVRLQ